MAKYEHELSAFDDLGLSDIEMDDCLTYLLSFVQANARAAHEATSAAAGPDGDDTRWWARVGPLLARVLDERRYPRASRVGTTAGQAHGSAHNPDHAYHFGLARLLDGIAPLIERL